MWRALRGKYWYEDVAWSMKHHHMARIGVILVLAALAVGMVGCVEQPSKDLEIRDWYDLDAVRENLTGNHRLMNDLDAATAGYDELASPAANGGKGWQPIGRCEGNRFRVFEGTFDGQGYEIRDLFINRPEESCVGVFGAVGSEYGAEEGIIENAGVVNATVAGGSFVGALVGHNSALTFNTVSNCYAAGSVVGNSSVGGLLGVTGGTVDGCYYMGNVTGITRVGGLVGLNGGAVSDCYSAGSVVGSSDIGGLLGYNHYGTVSNSYSISSVSGGESVGGLIGLNDESTVSDSFWDTETSGQSISDGGTGKNTAEMQDIAIFFGAGWNITAVAPNETNPAYIWVIVDGQSYPFLSWQQQPLA
jgi:hypothetical protein